MHENPLESTLTFPALVSTGPEPELAEKLVMRSGDFARRKRRG